jgi:predicted HTH transcriptional regulator
MEIRESNRVEYKRELNEKLEREVVAFLNYHQGGMIYLGIDDAGNVIGIKSIDDVQLKVADRLKNNILPSTLGLFDVIAEKFGGRDILKILISSGPEKPYYLRKYGMSPAGCFIRVGSSVQPMTTEMIDIAYARRVRHSLGNIPSRRQDLTFEQLKIYYEAAGFHLNQHFAKNLGLITEDGRFNHAAFLLADENDVSIKVAKYSGMDKIDLIDNAEFGFCSLVKATKSVIDKLDVLNAAQTKITGKERQEKRLVDVVALREAVLNAMIHNNYVTAIPPLVEVFSDRVVITSSGGLPQDLTVDEFFSGISAPRNKELMRVFKDLKLAEQIGSGMKRILSVYNRSAFEISEHFLRVTFHYHDLKPTSDVGINVRINVGIKLSATQRKIIQAITEDSNVTVPKLAQITGVSERQVQRVIKKLSEDGFIAHRGSRKSGSWIVIKPIMDESDAKDLLKQLNPLAEQISSIRKKMGKLLADGVISREQYNDIMWVPEEENHGAGHS